MTAVAEQLISQLDELSPQERAEIAIHLIRHLDEVEIDDGYDEAWATEIDRRMEEVTSGKVQGIPADEAIARIRQLIS
jgi:putative addiction module component (TIGR02574 family)